MGEAASKVSAELRERYCEIPWGDMRGLRNIVVHNYFGTDWEEVWNTATVDVPVLEMQVRAIIAAEFGDGVD